MMRARGIWVALLAAAICTAAATPPAAIPSWGADDPRFERALKVREFEFPRDHGPHPGFAREWWYLTGHLMAPSGERFGFELTFFRVALAPPNAAPAPADASRWRARQIYVAHFAVTDIDRGRFRFAERYARDALGLSGAESDPLHVWIGDWSLGAAGDAWHIQAAESGYALNLSMSPELPPVLNGEHGLSQKSGAPYVASYYYSIPRLAVRGQIVRDGKALNVSGRAWLDREWGSDVLASAEEGWDWFALQLADGSCLMFYSIRRRDGSQDLHSAGTFVAGDGRVRALASTDVDIEVQSYWASPRGGRYPARWSVRVPSLALSVALHPVLADQELKGPPRYWEGAVEVSGTLGTTPIGGAGYVELVGYSRVP
jgi:predicted secreted hydrolase